jgi:predicted methyltransferase
MTVVEIWPAGGWYTQILAPVLRDKGKLYLAHVAIESPKLENWQRESRQKLAAVMADKPEVYGKPLFTSLAPPEYVAIAPPGSTDLVLTFRNVHNWSKQRSDAQVFKAFFDALNPGGVLGVVEHRAKPDTPFEAMVNSGYMT